MKIADDRCHRVLAYLESVQRNGYTPTVAQVNGYASRATRRARGFSEMLADFRAVMPKIQESALIWLYRVEWIDIHGEGEEIEDEDTVTITPLGRAALAALEEEAEATRVEAPIAISLDKDDPMALAKVIGRIAEAGPSALIDRYFSEEVFLAVVNRTEVERLLTGPKPPGRIAAIEQALADYSIEREFEVRVDEDDEHHDRFLIPDRARCGRSARASAE